VYGPTDYGCCVTANMDTIHSYYGIRSSTLEWIQNFVELNVIIILNGHSYQQSSSHVQRAGFCFGISDIFLLHITCNILLNIKLYANNALLYGVIRSTCDKAYRETVVH